MWYKNGVSRKALILLFAFILMFTLSGGFSKAFADQDIQSRLTDWFENRKNESINEMDKAITSEKNRLMDQLRLELQLEMQRAQAQLARHTAAETAQSIKELEKYAAELASGIHVSNEAEKEAVSSSIDTALEDAKALIKGSAIVPKESVVTQPEAELEPDVEGTIEKPEVQKPVQETTPKPIPTPNPNPNPNPLPEDKPSVSVPEFSESTESDENE